MSLRAAPLEAQPLPPLAPTVAKAGNGARADKIELDDASRPSALSVPSPAPSPVLSQYGEGQVSAAGSVSRAPRLLSVLVDKDACMGEVLEAFAREVGV